MSITKNSHSRWSYKLSLIISRAIRDGEENACFDMPEGELISDDKNAIVSTDKKLIYWIREDGVSYSVKNSKRTVRNIKSLVRKHAGIVRSSVYLKCLICGETESDGHIFLSGDDDGERTVCSECRGKTSTCDRCGEFEITEDMTNGYCKECFIDYEEQNIDNANEFNYMDGYLEDLELEEKMKDAKKNNLIISVDKTNNEN